MEWDSAATSQAIKGYVRYLAMLPGHESESATLVEYAVNLSLKAGRGGRVYFPTFMCPTYEFNPPWFEWLHSNDIDPIESNQWEMLGNKWRLKRRLLGVESTRDR